MANLFHLLKYLAYFRSDDDLVLTASLGYTQNTFSLLDGVCVSLGFILEHKAESRSAVRYVLDIVSTADKIKHGLGHLFVVHFFLLFFYKRQFLLSLF